MNKPPPCSLSRSGLPQPLCCHCKDLKCISGHVGHNFKSFESLLYLQTFHMLLDLHSSLSILTSLISDQCLLRILCSTSMFQINGPCTHVPVAKEIWAAHCTVKDWGLNKNFENWFEQKSIPIGQYESEGARAKIFFYRRQGSKAWKLFDWLQLQQLHYLGQPSLTVWLVGFLTLEACAKNDSGMATFA